MPWKVVEAIDTPSITQITVRVPTPRGSVGKRAIIQLGQSTYFLLPTVNTGLFWTTVAAAQTPITTYPAPYIELTSGAFGNGSQGSAVMLPAVGDFVGLRLQSTSLSTPMRAVIAFEY